MPIICEKRTPPPRRRRKRMRRNPIGPTNFRFFLLSSEVV
jgi:hypothetical protein